MDEAVIAAQLIVGQKRRRLHTISGEYRGESTFHARVNRVHLFSARSTTH
ncbi:MAG: hypothetical protein P8X86_21500 [Desulfofustis sp.]|jgi:hypothetical protein